MPACEYGTGSDGAGRGNYKLLDTSEAATSAYFLKRETIAIFFAPYVPFAYLPACLPSKASCLPKPRMLPTLDLAARMFRICYVTVNGMGTSARANRTNMYTLAFRGQTGNTTPLRITINTRQFIKFYYSYYLVLLLYHYQYQ